MKCICCKKEKEVEEMYVYEITYMGKKNPPICKQCAREIQDSFIYGVGGMQVCREKYDRIVKRGYIIPEELDDERNQKDN